jgi:hypothetical protein
MNVFRHLTLVYLCHKVIGGIYLTNVALKLRERGENRAQETQGLNGEKREENP